MSTVNANQCRTYLPREIAEQLRVADDTVRGWVASGELEALNLARRGAKKPRYVITADSLQRFMASRTVLPPTPASTVIVRRRKVADDRERRVF